ncbi:MAG: hypothetical protein AB1505_24135 [Candidatus Latescibacterota bacterium]
MGRRLAGQQTPYVLAGDTLGCPRDPLLAITVLRAGLPWTAPEHVLTLPGHSAYLDMPPHAQAATRRLWVDQALAHRQGFLLALAECHRALGERAQAVRCLEESAAVRRQIAWSHLIGDPTYFLLGQGYERLGRWADAERAYLQAAAQDYGHAGAEAALRRLYQQRHGDAEELGRLLAACHPPAPAFVLHDTLGCQVRLSDYRGRVLLLYYDTASGPDGQALEAITAWARGHAPEELEVLHVTRSAAPRDSPFTRVLDDDGVGDRYGLRTSSLVLIDRQGRLRLRRAVLGEWPRSEVAVKVAEVVGEARL